MRFGTCSFCIQTVKQTLSLRGKSMNMIQKILYAGAASAALFAVAPASAATVSDKKLTFVDANSGFYGADILGAGLFEAAFEFAVPSSGSAGVSFTSISFTTQNAIKNLVVSLNGVSYPISEMGTAGVFSHKFGLFSQNVGSGTQMLRVSGEAVNPVSSSFGGSINFIAAVPEPASWALMIGGFGLVGGAMRRRAKQINVSVAYA